MPGEAFRLRGVIDLDTKGVDQGLSATEQKVSGFGSKVAGVFSGVGSSIKGVVGGLGAFGLAVQGVQAAVDVVKGAGSLVGLGALNEMEQTRASFNAFTKDAGKTEEIMAAVRKEAALTPFAFGEMAKATASLMPVAKQSGIALMDLVKEAEILAASNPLEGLEGASFSLREAMTGDFTSIIERFNLSRSSINKWKDEGVPNIEIVRRAMQEMGFDTDLIAAKAETLDGRWSTFQDTLVTLQTRIGQPIFDAMKEGLVGLQGALDENMGAMEAFADMIGSSIKDAIEGAKVTFQTLAPVVAEVWTSMSTAFSEMVPTIQTVGAAISGLFAVFSGTSSIDVLTRTSDALTSLFGPDATTLIMDFVSLAGQAFQEIGQTIMQAVGGVITWFRENWPLIQQTFQTVIAAIADFWEAHGETIMTVIKSAWTIVKEVIGTSLQNVGDIIKTTMQLINGDWSGAWQTMTGVFERSVNSWGTILGAAFTAIVAVLDNQTGGTITKVTTWIQDTTTRISDGWDRIKTATSTAWEAIKTAIITAVDSVITPVTTAWKAIETTTDTIFRAIKNVMTAIWDEIYNSVIKPKLDTIKEYVDTVWNSISTAISTKLTEVKTSVQTGWDAVSSATKTVLDPILTYVRDTIFEPIRAAIADKIDGAKTAFDTGIKAIDTAARTVLDPFLRWWRETIWEPVRLATESATTGPTGAVTLFKGGVNDISAAVTGTMDGVKNTWETIWKAITKAAESPKQAMEVIIDLVGKLKSIMPDWLIPHSPTPFQIGIEGIMKAVKNMDAAFRNVGGGTELIGRIAAMATSIGGIDFGRAAAAIAASETGGGAHLSEIGGTGAKGPFQFDPGGELINFARDLRVSMSEAAMIAVMEPMRAAQWALTGYLGKALRQGLELGLKGPALAIYGSRVGQRPAAGNEQMAGEWYRRLFGMRAGGIVMPRDGGTPVILGEGGRPEAVVPLPRSFTVPDVGNIGNTVHTFVVQEPSGRVLAEWYVRGKIAAVEARREVPGGL